MLQEYCSTHASKFVFLSATWLLQERQKRPSVVRTSCGGLLLRDAVVSYLSQEPPGAGPWFEGGNWRSLKHREWLKEGREGVGGNRRGLLLSV